jgi:hypothetical protein
MKTRPAFPLLLFLILSYCAGWVRAQDQQLYPVTLKWDPNSDGDVTDYRLYLGQAHGFYGPAIEVKGATQFTIMLPKAVLHYAVVSAVNTSGVEGLPCADELVFQVGPQAEIKAPSPPVNLRKVAMGTLSIETSRDLQVWSTVYSELVNLDSSKFFRLSLSAE